MDKLDKNTDCSNCTSNMASVRCLDCKQYLCDMCHTLHKGLKFMQTHKVVSMEDILSGKVNIHAEERTICKEHNEYHKYYCKNEQKVICHDCIILKTCADEHTRITIDKAAQEKSEELSGLVQDGHDILKKYQESVKEVDVIKKELYIHCKTAKAALLKVEWDYIKLVKKTVKRFEDEIDNIKEQRMKELDTQETNLNSTIYDFERANEEIAQVLQSAGKLEVISNYNTLSSKLTGLCKSQLRKTDKTLGYIKFEAAIPANPRIGQLLKEGKLGEPWKHVGQLSTGDFNRLCGLALDEDDNIVICSSDKGVKVFARNAHEDSANIAQSSLYESPGSITVGVLPGQKYVSAPRGTMQIKICDSQGKQAITRPITNVNNVASQINSLAVDSDNHIIVGQVRKTISIHNADGSLVSKFATQSVPFRLAANSNGQIVCSFYDSKYTNNGAVRMMDYSGSNISELIPPNEVTKWCPEFVCCGQGEIFVANEGAGDPRAVYRYTSEGDFLGCVTTQVANPSGIALSRDNMELFVADCDSNHVQIFQRP